MAQAPQQAAPAAASKERINVLAFNLAGHIKVNSRDVKSIVAASTLFAAAVAVLRGEGKPEDIVKEVKDALEGAQKNKLVTTITRDEDPQFKTVSADSGEE